jgi:homoserine dehydrogenase
VVVELVGGTRGAPILETAIGAGKSVVTANKELITADLWDSPFASAST